MNEGLKEMIERACFTCGGSDFTKTMVNADELKNLLNMMLKREDELLKRIKVLEAQNIMQWPIK